MSKRKKKKLKLTANEEILEKLHKMVREGHDKADVAHSLIQWYMENKYWTEKQLAFAKAISSRKKRKAPVRKKYNLYAIQAGYRVKLGYSHNPKKRLKEIQTGSPDHLKLLWTYYVGDDEKTAMQKEKKLHRVCKKYHVRGEWYDIRCMDLVQEFTVKERYGRNRAIEELDNQALANSPLNDNYCLNKGKEK